MPNRSALIRRLAYLLNISYPKAHLCGVMLSEADQVKSGGRGRSAPNMTARDAFAILIAVTAAEKNSEAIQAVSTYSNILNEDGEKFRDILTLILDQPEAAEHIKNLRGRVLDVGCGEQLYRDELAPLVRSGAVEYHGLDPDEHSLADLATALPEGRYEVGGIEGFRAEPGSYDHVLCLRSLNHVVDAGDAIARMAEVVDGAVE